VTFKFLAKIERHALPLSQNMHYPFSMTMCFCKVLMLANILPFACLANLNLLPSVYATFATLLVRMLHAKMQSRAHWKALVHCAPKLHKALGQPNSNENIVCLPKHQANTSSLVV